MKFKRRLQLEPNIKEISIIPLVNVLFLMLVFFVLTPNYIEYPGIKVNLPKAVTSEIISPNNIELTVSNGNLIYLNNQPVEFEGLKIALKDIAKQGVTVLIKADKGVVVSKLMPVLDLCRQYGINGINIATEQE